VSSAGDGKAELAEELRLRRIALGWTLVQVAAQAQVSVGMLSLIETGKRRPSLRSWERIRQTIRWFTTGNPSRAIQQILTRAGFLFLAIVLDVFSRRVIGSAMGPSAELRLGRCEGGRRLPGPQPHLRLAGAVGIERGDVVAQPQAAII
jgi:transposase InsO family protein